jgi:hypothetical protein
MRSLNDANSHAVMGNCAAIGGCRPTFVFSYVLQCECEACVLALNDTHFSKGTLSDDSQ